MKKSIVIAGLASTALAAPFVSTATDEPSDQVAASFERMLTEASAVPTNPLPQTHDEDPLLPYFSAVLWDSSLSVCAFSNEERPVPEAKRFRAQGAKPQ